MGAESPYFLVLQPSGVHVGVPHPGVGAGVRKAMRGAADPETTYS
jgi:hypothetical protein